MSINPGQQPRQGFRRRGQELNDRLCWLWFESWGFDECFEVLQGMASDQVIINPNFLPCHWGQVHHAHSSAFPAEMLGQALQSFSDARERHDVAIKNKAYLTAVKGDI